MQRRWSGRTGAAMVSSSACFRRLPVQVWIEAGALRVRASDTQRAVRLDETGRRIWELLEYPVTLDEVAGRLAAEYAGDAGTIRSDVEACVAFLSRKGVVEACDPPSVAGRQRARYLGLLKRSLVNLVYPEHELRIRHLEKVLRARERPEEVRLEETRLLRDIRYRQPEAYRALADAKLDCIGGLAARIPFCFPHTLLGISGLDNLERAAETVFTDGIPGDFLEAGVCQGGASIFLRALQVAFGQEERRVWVADSFEGLPAPEHPVDVGSGLDFTEPSLPILAFGLEGVRDNFIRYDLLDERVSFLPGWFADTLPSAPTGPLAVLRMDGDLYSSTREILEALYDRVSPGGFVIADDYGFLPPCRQAVDEFRAELGIDEPLHLADRTVAYWRKG